MIGKAGARRAPQVGFAALLVTVVWGMLESENCDVPALKQADVSGVQRPGNGSFHSQHGVL